MKILWISNVLFPDVCNYLGITPPVNAGWVYSSAKNLILHKNVRLGVVMIYEGKRYKSVLINGIHYFLIPKYRKKIKYQKRYNKYWLEIKNSFNPDIIHIHGTEFGLGMSYLKACGNKNVVLSIQGLVSVIERYMYANIDFFSIIKFLSLRDILHHDSIFHLRKQFKKRGGLEREYLMLVNNFIGRTFWDKTHIWAINDKANYYLGNEILRSGFYGKKWIYSSCEKHTIFISQATYPVKGLHILLKALPLVKRYYPDIKVYIAGKNFVSKKTFWQRITIKGYGRYVLSIIKQNKLTENIIFLGELNEKEMISRFLKSNVFVLPSSIENSPNSLGEAQILGVPSIATYVGGVPDMSNNNSILLYRFEEYEMLAKHICSIFLSKDLANMLSQKSISEAEERHDKSKNIIDLLRIYHKIITND